MLRHYIYIHTPTHTQARWTHNAGTGFIKISKASPFSLAWVAKTSQLLHYRWTSVHTSIALEGGREGEREREREGGGGGRVATCKRLMSENSLGRHNSDRMTLTTSQGWPPWIQQCVDFSVNKNPIIFSNGTS